MSGAASRPIPVAWGRFPVADVTVTLTQEEAAFVLNELHCAGHGHGSSKDDFEAECPTCTAADKLKALLADGVMAAPAPSSADERMRHDYPILQQFHSKHALGALSAPSCLCCGQQTHPITRPIAVQHMELPAIVVCKQCKDATGVTAAPAPSTGPFTMEQMVAFLLGEAPLDGVWFGERHPGQKGAFWWRRFLRAAPGVPPSGDKTS